MASVTQPTAIGQLLADYVNKAAQTLADDERPVGRIFIAPGTSAPDDDCCEGQVWSRLVSLAPAEAPANVRGTAAPCGVLFFIATVEVGVMRCAATVDSNGVAPTQDAVTNDALYETRDAALLMKAIMCDPRTRSMGQWSPRGVQGGCVGGMWQFTTRIETCGC